MSTSRTVESIRGDFPLLATQSHGKPLAYLDNAATTQKPASVIDATSSFYRTANANAHRGIYELAEKATDLFESTRATVRNFLHSRSDKEIIFTRGTTEGVNLVASTWGRQNVKSGDVILVSEMEHHANLVPWQQLAHAAGAELRFVPVTDEGRLDAKAFSALLADAKVKLVAITAASNVLGTITPVKELVKKAHAAGALVFVDAAQAAAHMPINVQSWNCDFLALSGHKMYGPTGVGILYGKEVLLEEMPPFFFGGDMILEVQKEQSTWNDLPWKFEAGTQNIAGVVAYAAALDYIRSIGWEWIQRHERELTERLIAVLAGIPGVTIYGPHKTTDRLGVASFSVQGIHPHDLATIFDQEGLAIRSGHHCAQVLMERLGVSALARASTALYTSKEEIDRIPTAIERAQKILQPHSRR